MAEGFDREELRALADEAVVSMFRLTPTEQTALALGAGMLLRAEAASVPVEVLREHCFGVSISGEGVRCRCGAFMSEAHLLEKAAEWRAQR